jgi:branched-chain amino acid transport system permease protein
MIDYVVNTATLGIIWCLFGYAVNVSWGWTGLLDLAPFMYIAVGAYVYGVIVGPPPNAGPTVQWILGLNAPFIFGLIAAPIVTGLLGLIVGGVALRRLREDYFAITTVVTTLTVYAFIAQYVPLFDGYTGVYGIQRPLVDVLNVDASTYGIIFLGGCLVILAGVYVVMERMFKSPFGRQLRAARDDETAAAAFGRDVYRVKLKGYVIGAVIAGIGGAMMAAFLQAFNPYAWSAGETFLIYAAIFVGGSGNNRGVILGTFFIAVVVQEVTRLFVVIPGHPDAAAAVRYMVVGLLIIAVLWWRPKGLLPEPRDRDRGPSLPLPPPLPDASGTVDAIASG